MSEGISMAQFKTVLRLPVAPKALYKAWLSSREHSAMTGGKATVSPRKGGRFTAWDDHIRGKNLKLKPHWCIVQSWRTSEFPPRAKDSQIELCIHPSGKTDSKLIFFHTRLTPKQVRQYRAGWRAHYWRPMKKYFAKKQRKAR
jgi:activator of HSP90 ATPase